MLRHSLFFCAHRRKPAVGCRLDRLTVSLKAVSPMRCRARFLACSTLWIGNQPSRLQSGSLCRSAFAISRLRGGRGAAFALCRRRHYRLAVFDGSGPLKISQCRHPRRSTTALAMRASAGSKLQCARLNLSHYLLSLTKSTVQQSPLSTVRR